MLYCALMLEPPRVLIAMSSNIQQVAIVKITLIFFIYLSNEIF